MSASKILAGFLCVCVGLLSLAGTALVSEHALAMRQKREGAAPKQIVCPAPCPCVPRPDAPEPEIQP